MEEVSREGMMETASGEAPGRVIVEDASGVGIWRRHLGEASGGGSWRRHLEEESGSIRGKHLVEASVEEASGGGIWRRHPRGTLFIRQKNVFCEKFILLLLLCRFLEVSLTKYPFLQGKLLPGAATALANLSGPSIKTVRTPTVRHCVR